MDRQSLSLLIELLPDGVLLSSQEGNIVLCNSQAGRLFGYEKDELEELSIHELIPTPARINHQQYVQKYMTQPSARSMSQHAGLEGLRKDESTFSVDISLNPIEVEGEMLVMAVLRDLTEKLERERLQQKNKELERFSYIASHDLQEPLRTIQSFTKILMSKDQSGLDAQSVKSLDFISQSADRMSNLIKSLLDYSRLGKERELEQVDLNEIVTQVQVDLGQKIEETGAEIKVGDLPVIVGSRTDLRLYFQNIIANGIKFQTPGSSPCIEVRCEEEKGSYTIAIQDNGIGIAPENHAKVFQVFERLHAKRDYEGTGIGLANCARIAENHGGRIWVESDLGEGSTFYLQLNKKA